MFKSIWQDKSGYYYVFGFLSVVSAILASALLLASLLFVLYRLGRLTWAG